MKRSLSGSGTPRRARLWTPPLAGAVCVLALVWPAQRAESSIVRGYGNSWQPVANAAAGSGSQQAASGRTFHIGGSVGGLWPGDATHYTLLVTNPNGSAIDVTSITTTVMSASASCGASLLKVGPFTGNLNVPAKTAVHTTVSVDLDRTAPNACQGAVWPLEYSGTGTGG